MSVSLIDPPGIMYILLTEFVVRTVSYGPSVFLTNLWIKREARGDINLGGENEDP